MLWKVAGWICLGLPSAAGVHRWRAQIQEQDGSRRGLGRWATADGFIPPFATGVFFDSFQSLWAMGFFLLKVMLGVFFGGGLLWI